jgi:hypothetical protein
VAEERKRIETISSMLGHRDLKMTLRYAAVMPTTLRREFDQAFAAIDEEHRVTAQVRVVLSPCVRRAKTDGHFGGSRTRKTADAVQPKRLKPYSDFG